MYRPPPEFENIIASTVEKLLRASQPSFDDEDGWILLKKDKNGVCSHKKKDIVTKGERSISTVRGRGLVRCDARTYRDMVVSLDPPLRQRWDLVFNQGRIVKELDEFTNVVWMELRTKKCVLDFHRDLLWMQHSREMANGIFVVASRSAGVVQDDSLVPVPRGAIRATLHTSGYVIRPLNDELGNCEVSFVTQVDVRGMPAVVLNRLAEEQPQCIYRQRLLYAELFGGGKMAPATAIHNPSVSLLRESSNRPLNADGQIDSVLDEIPEEGEVDIDLAHLLMMDGDEQEQELPPQQLKASKSWKVASVRMGSVRNNSNDSSSMSESPPPKVVPVSSPRARPLPPLPPSSLNKSAPLPSVSPRHK